MFLNPNCKFVKHGHLPSDTSNASLSQEAMLSKRGIMNTIIEEGKQKHTPIT